MTVKTIILRGDGIAKERIANAAITPGYLVEEMSTGKLRKHASAAAFVIPAFAREDEVVGKGIDGDYAALDTCKYTVPFRGTEIFALVAASAVAIVIGDFLESAGDGTLRLVTVGDEPDYTITWTADEPVAGDAATIADGDTPTVAETGQAIADITAKINTLLPGGSQNIVARALEAVDNSGGGSEARIKVEIV